MADSSDPLIFPSLTISLDSPLDPSAPSLAPSRLSLFLAGTGSSCLESELVFAIKTIPRRETV